MDCTQNKARDRVLRAVGSAAVAAAFAFSAPGAHAQSAWKPEKNVEIVVGAAVGGGTDLTSRVAQKIIQDMRLVDSSTVVNKPGGGQTIAWAYLNQHVGDGHYISIINEPFVTNRIMGVSALDYNDFTPLALLFDEYVIFAVKPGSPIKSGKDIVNRLRAGADSMTFAFGSSRGNNTHLAIGLVGKLADAQMSNMKIVVFGSGGAATTALLGGHVDVLVTTPTPIREQIKAGLARGIAMTSPQRLGGDLADVPTWREQGVDAVLSSWRVVFGPKGMTREQIAFWVNVFAKISATKEWQSDLDQNARERHFLTGGDLHKFLDAQRTQLEVILAGIGMAKR